MAKISKLTGTGVGAKFPRTAQTVQAHPKQVQNHAGGFSFQVDDWKRFERFLILGSEGGTYYVQEPKLTLENCRCAQACVTTDGPRAVKLIVDISDAGRAYRNTPAIFALALAAAQKGETARLALAALPKVARIGTHLFQFVTALTMGDNPMRGWGPGLRKAVAKWYTDRDLEQLAIQLLKYRQRDGVSHHDVLHLAHVRPANDEQSALFKLAKDLAHKGRTLKGEDGEELPPTGVSYDGSSQVAKDFLALQECDKAAKAIKIIGKNKQVTWEMIPSTLLGDPEIWEALLVGGNLPMTAMVRNLGRMTANGLLITGGLLSKKAAAVGEVIRRLNDEDQIKKARLHPVQVLAALLTYKAGRGGKGSLTWNPVGEIVEALDGAFYKSFKYLPTTGKRYLFGLDVSASMTSPDLMDIPGLTPRVGSAAMAMAIARTEPMHAFMGFSHELVPVPITAKQRLDDVCQTIGRIPMGGTDCALPIKYAIDHKLQVDCFVTLTDNETWAGGGYGSRANSSGHVHEMIEEYRAKSGIPAKLVIVGMVSNDLSCANPDDAGQLDVTGFDASVPTIIADFASAAM